MTWPPSAPPPSGPAHRRGIRIFLASVVASVGLIALVGGLFVGASILETRHDLAPARLAADVEQLAAMLPTIEGLELTYYDGDPGCRSFSYHRGEFTDSPDFSCTGGRSGVPFDSAANLDLAQFQAALAATGLDVNRISPLPPSRGFGFDQSVLAYEFDTSPPRWCLLCPSVKFYHGFGASRPVDDLLDHYVAVNADWFVDIHYEGLQLGP